MGKVLVDLDGVLVDFLSSVKSYLNKSDKDLIIENITRYNFKGDIGCERADVFEAMGRFEVFRNAGYYAGALASLERLQDVSDTYGYTLIPSNLFIMGHRTKQLFDLGLSGEPLLANKDGRKGVVSGDWDAVFDDSIEVLQDWLDVPNVKLFLIDHTYNREVNYPECSSVFKRVIRCKDFNEAVDKYINLMC